MSEIETGRPHPVLNTSQTIITLYREIFCAIRNVLKRNEKLRNISLKYTRDLSRKLYIFPDEVALKTPLYLLRTAIAIGIFAIFWGTIMINLYTSFDDIAAFGENIMFAIAASMVLFKIIVIVVNWKQIELIINTFIKLNQRLADLNCQNILQIQRTFFIIELGMLLIFSIVGICLFATLSIQPIFSEQSIPLPALFPFDIQDSKKHPWGSKLVYGFQAMSVFYAILALLVMDSLGLCCITQCAANLRILAVRLRKLGINDGGQKQAKDLWSELRDLVEMHQEIISLVDQINDAFYFAYLLQVFSSTFMLGTASFEALLAMNDVKVAFKFVFFMMTAILQLVYWCIMGNIAYSDSQEVAIAGFDVHEWFAQSPALQRNLMFLIQRAQKPLQFYSRPFLPFTMETFTKIIRVSYTAFTVLSNSLYN